MANEPKVAGQEGSAKGVGPAKVKEPRGLDLEGTVKGLINGAKHTANLMLVVGAIAVSGYVVGDLVPSGVNYLENQIGISQQYNLPKGFGVPAALGVAENAITGHDDLKDVPMGYLMAAPLAAAYFAKGVVKPVADSVFGRKEEDTA